MVTFALLASHGCFTRKLAATHVGVELWNIVTFANVFDPDGCVFWSCDVEINLGSLAKFDNNSWCSQICARAMHVPTRAGRAFWTSSLCLYQPNLHVIFEYGACFPKTGRGIGCQHWMLSWLLLFTIGQSRKIKGNWQKLRRHIFQTIALDQSTSCSNRAGHACPSFAGRLRARASFRSFRVARTSRQQHCSNAWKLPSKTAPTRPYQTICEKKVRGKKIWFPARPIQMAKFVHVAWHAKCSAEWKGWKKKRKAIFDTSSRGNFNRWIGSLVPVRQTWKNSNLKRRNAGHLV